MSASRPGTKAPEPTAFAAAMASAQCPTRSGDPLWIERLRRNGRAAFASSGLPTRRDESWRQTPVETIAGVRYEPVAGGAPESSPAPTRLDRLGLPEVRVQDGRDLLESSGSALPEGVWAGPLSEALARQPETIEPILGALSKTEASPFAALNAANLDEGIVLLIDAGAVIDRPILLTHVASVSRDPSVRFPRTLISVGGGGRASVVERFIGGGGAAPTLTCPVSEAHVARGAVLEHVVVVDGPDAHFHVTEIGARVAREGRYHSVVLTLASDLARYDIGVRLDEPGGEATLDGLYVPRDGQHVDHQTVLDHAAPHCASRELYKGILSGRSRAVFTGRIVVREGAQKTNAVQNNRNLLLSADATVHARPQLEIYADDVKCTHGATIGRLDRDAMFYLRARGIARDAAQEMLLRAFAAGVLRAVSDEALREALSAMMLERLPSA